MSNESGYLSIFLGPMFSGKTTALIEKYKKYTFIGKKVLVINFSGDTRYSIEKLSTHDGQMIPCIWASTLSDIKYTEYDVILINEGQFFSDLYDTVINMINIEKKRVYICGLDGDFKRNKFGQLLELIPVCDNVIKLKALCSWCRNGKEAIFSHRISEEAAQIVIGSDNYVPLCRDCYDHA
jgi:thymidine kinase